MGAIRFRGRGNVGAAVFSAAGAAASAAGATSAKAGGVPKFVIFAAVGISLPVLASIAAALPTPALTAASPAVALKLPIAVTMLALAIYYWAVNMVSVARYKYKVPAPATVGVSADFDRYLRVQINMLEQLALFMPTLWLSATLVSPVSASIAGAMWCVGRVLYANGYYADAASRGKGFGIAALAQIFLLTTAGIGAARTFLA